MTVFKFKITRLILGLSKQGSGRNNGDFESTEIEKAGFDCKRHLIMI